MSIAQAILGVIGGALIMLGVLGLLVWRSIENGWNTED